MSSSQLAKSTLTCSMFCQSLAHTWSWSVFRLASDGSFVNADRILNADAAAICHKLVESDVFQIYLARLAGVGRSDWLHHRFSRFFELAILKHCWPSRRKLTMQHLWKIVGQGFSKYEPRIDREREILHCGIQLSSAMIRRSLEATIAQTQDVPQNISLLAALQKESRSRVGVPMSESSRSR